MKRSKLALNVKEFFENILFSRCLNKIKEQIKMSD